VVQAVRTGGGRRGLRPNVALEHDHFLCHDDIDRIPGSEDKPGIGCFRTE
jgi:hypothetical protein